MPDGSRLALGATTVALVGLASAGTSLLISHGTKTLEVPPTALPSRSTVGHPPAAGGLVVPRVPGSFVAARPSAAPAPHLAADRAGDVLPALLGRLAGPVVAPVDLRPVGRVAAALPDVTVPVVLPSSDPVAVLVPGSVTYVPQTSRDWSRFGPVPAPSPTPTPTSGPVLEPSTSGTTHPAKSSPTRTEPAKAKPAKARSDKGKPTTTHGKSGEHRSAERPTTSSPRHDGR